MVIAVVGSRGMLGRRVMERFPDAIATNLRSTGELEDPLLDELERIDPDWVIDCAGAIGNERDMWTVNAVLPHRIAHRWRLILPSTDHVWDDTEYARSKRLGECGHVIRCAIVDPDGGLLARCNGRDTYGETDREWNGITAKAWAEIAAEIIEGRLTGTVIPGSPTVSHLRLQDIAREVFGWGGRTIPSRRHIWHATAPNLMLPPIEVQLAEYL